MGKKEIMGFLRRSTISLQVRGSAVLACLSPFVHCIPSWEAYLVVWHIDSQNTPDPPHSPLSNYVHYGLILVMHLCMTFLRKPRDLPFPFSAQLHAAFCSLSSPDHARSRARHVQSNQGAAPEQSWSNPRAVQEHTLITQTQATTPDMESNKTRKAKPAVSPCETGPHSFSVSI